MARLKLHLVKIRVNRRITRVRLMLRELRWRIKMRWWTFWGRIGLFLVETGQKWVKRALLETQKSQFLPIVRGESRYDSWEGDRYS